MAFPLMRSLVEAAEMAMTKQYRKRVSRRIYAELGGEVRYGPFKGLRLEDGSHISDGPLALKVLGLYEQELLDEITARPVQTLVNMGGADGYYSVGMLRADLAERSIAFEMDPAGRETIARNAKANGVADRITVLEKATEDWAARVLELDVDPARTLVLCDIEGMEFELITPEAVAALPGASYMIELHHALVPDGETKLERLQAALEPTHRTQVLRSGPPRWSGIAEVEALRDLERALVTSQGRKMIGEWMVARPR